MSRQELWTGFIASGVDSAEFKDTTQSLLRLCISIRERIPQLSTGFITLPSVESLIRIRAVFIAPILQIAINVCLVMVVMVFLERVYMLIVMIYITVGRRVPWRLYKFEPLADDIELGSSHYPVILVQVPMYNERQVYKLSIGAVCSLKWPADRLVIQILDDSTDPEVKLLVHAECQSWSRRGVNVKYEVRKSRKGYKAGALREGMKRPYVSQCDHVAIFDADFQPEPDFLLRCVPYLIHNPEVGLVQGRWKFVNKDECLMTKMQAMSLNFHFEVEQTVGSAAYAFFGFNGTAGVWRISALDGSGGWQDRTTVEDMDLAVRASIQGWKFVYINTLRVKSELPSVFKSFRNQQHRWSCGPANLLRKMVPQILANDQLKSLKKFHMVYSFFLVRKIIGHIVTFIFYCLVLPTAVLVPECNLPAWGVIFVPTFITLMNISPTPLSFHMLVFWVLYENVMSMHRTKGTFIGLFNLGSVDEWVVTEKGPKDKVAAVAAAKAAAKPAISESSTRKGLSMKLRKFRAQIHVGELTMGTYLIFAAAMDFYFSDLGRYHFYVYLLMQGAAFYLMGFGYIGT